MEMERREERPRVDFCNQQELQYCTLTLMGERQALNSDSKEQTQRGEKREKRAWLRVAC